MSKIDRSAPPKLKQAKKLNIAAWIVTVVVLGLIGAMRRIHLDLPEGWDFSGLPMFYSMINAATAVVLILALIWVRKGQYERHQKAMTTALVLSGIFLFTYVAYHLTTSATIYGDLDGDGLLSATESVAIGSMRIVYLLLLLTHIVLAAVIFPFILFTYIRAYTNQYNRHKKIARWVFPLWLYVAITGPILYFMLLPYYQ